MKFPVYRPAGRACRRSLPSRGAWIEIDKAAGLDVDMGLSLPSRGAWIEIAAKMFMDYVVGSLPSRGAWIEIGAGSLRIGRGLRSLPSRGAWIEMRPSTNP